MNRAKHTLISISILLFLTACSDSAVEKETASSTDQFLVNESKTITASAIKRNGENIDYNHSGSSPQSADKSTPPRKVYSVDPRVRSVRQIDYKNIEQKMRAGCTAAQTDDTQPFTTVIVPLGGGRRIEVQADWLPINPYNPDQTIAGIDLDGDCVRDDIEHHIARQYPDKEDYKLRKYLYDYAVWMNQFLSQHLSEARAKNSYKKMAQAGICVQRILGSADSRTTIDDLFANFHNTIPRTERYLENLPTIGGWTTREEIKVECK